MKFVLWDELKNGVDMSKMEAVSDWVINCVKKYWLPIAIVFLVFAVYFIWCVPMGLAIRGNDSLNKIRATHATIVGGMGAFIIIIVQIYRANLLKKQIEQQKEQNDEQRRANINSLTLDQYVRAVDQLKDENMAVRLGGIYSLEKIMNSENKEDYKFHDVIIELFCAYVREDRPVDEEEYKKNPSDYLVKYKVKVLTDIRAILTVLGRRVNRYNEKVEIDLKNTNWINADLNNMKLEGFNLSGSHLEHADLFESNLKGADLSFTHLEHAILIDAHLEGVYLNVAHLEYAELMNAHLQDSKLYGTNLSDADLSKANFTGAIFKAIHLNNARLNNAILINIKLLFPNEEREEMNTDRRIFINELARANNVYGIELDDNIMDIIKKEFPGLLKRINGEE